MTRTEEGVYVVTIRCSLRFLDLGSFSLDFLSAPRVNSPPITDVLGYFGVTPIEAISFNNINGNK
jgi:hypothetical protein